MVGVITGSTAAASTEPEMAMATMGPTNFITTEMARTTSKPLDAAKVPRWVADQEADTTARKGLDQGRDFKVEGAGRGHSGEAFKDLLH